MPNMSEEDLIALCQQLEQQELDSPSDVPPFVVYAKLLAMYMCRNMLCHVKFVWKRIPPEIKADNPELALIWEVGQNMWQRNYPGTYTALEREWSEPVASVMKLVKDAVRERALELIARAYSSISLNDFSLMVGLPSEQAVRLATRQGFLFDAASNMVQPKRAQPEPGETTSSEDQLHKLTEFVSFLEN